MANETATSHAEITPENILQQLPDFIDEKVAGLPTTEAVFAIDDHERKLEVQHAPSVRAENGYRYTCSYLPGGEDSPEVRIIEVRGRDNSSSKHRRITLAFYSDDTFTCVYERKESDTETLEFGGSTREPPHNMDRNLAVALSLTAQIVSSREASSPYEQPELTADVLRPADAESSPHPRFTAGVAVEQRKRRQDAALFDPERGIFGAFDGVGESEQSHYAAKLAAYMVYKHLIETKAIPEGPMLGKAYATYSALLNSMNIAHDAIVDWEDDEDVEGTTTAAVAAIVPIETPPDETQKYSMPWAAYGDSRIYVLRPDGEIVQISQDQGEGRYIYNYLGAGVDGPGPARAEEVWRQGNITELLEGSRVLICTDGITGDEGSDLLSLDEVFETLSKGNAQEAAEKFLAVARKKDDRTAIVVDVGRFTEILKRKIPAAKKLEATQPLPIIEDAA